MSLASLLREETDPVEHQTLTDFFRARGEENSFFLGLFMAIVTHTYTIVRSK